MKRVFYTVAHLNFFVETDVLQANNPQAIRQQTWATRIYLILLVNILFVLIMAASFNRTTTFETILAPTLEKYQQLEAKYSTTLSCSCKQSTIPYGDFISVNISLHPVTIRFCSFFLLWFYSKGLH